MSCPPCTVIDTCESHKLQNAAISVFFRDGGHQNSLDGVTYRKTGIDKLNRLDSELVLIR